MKKMILILIISMFISGCSNKVLDNEKPIITLKDSKDIVIYEGDIVPTLEYEVTDNVDKDIKVLVSDDVDNKKAGVYTIKYSAKDKSGNKTEILKKVTVMKKISVVDGITYVKGVLIVNKKYHLPSTYNPNVQKVALDAHANMKKDSKFPLTIISSFRSFSYQQKLFNDYANLHGITEANRFSAKAGESEHQTGLAFDITSLNQNYANTLEGIWLKNNCHKYGFIIRYPENKEAITGYMYEPWHIRYVGIDLATKIYNSGKTLEEYLEIN